MGSHRHFWCLVSADLSYHAFITQDSSIDAPNVEITSQMKPRILQNYAISDRQRLRLAQKCALHQGPGSDVGDLNPREDGCLIVIITCCHCPGADWRFLSLTHFLRRCCLRDVLFNALSHLGILRHLLVRESIGYSNAFQVH